MKETIQEKADKVIANTYARYNVAFERGQGSTLWDSEGKSYTDFVSGIAVCNLGHAHPGVAKALSDQALRLVHVSNLYYTRPQTELAEWLVSHSFADKVFFCNSGAEANEAAIKLARKYHYVKGDTGRNTIISMTMSFHGRTMATLTATGQDKIKEGFAPVLPGFDYVPYNDFESLKAKMSNKICAVMLEPLQGEGGICCLTPGYLKKVRDLCDAHGTLLIYDEIQTGMGRTGTLFAYEHEGVAPDIMTLAKALGNGLPIGAMLAKDEVMKAFTPGSHASTFGGTPLVTAAALEVVKTMEREKIVEGGREKGLYFTAKLESLKAKHPVVVDVRGQGLLLGMKLTVEGAPIVKACQERGFIINCVQGNTLRFIPPLIITKDEIDALIECLDSVLAMFK
ncbi:MAG: acetylornithine transaminase [Desulfobacteraceae bacterium]|jgi:acetylornithine aminotransferase